MPLGDLYQNHWSISGVDVPDAQTPDEAVFLPGRNALLAVKPLIWCQAHGIEELALATLAGNPFADATPDFCRRFAEAMAAGAPQPTTISQPFARLHKDAVLALGRHLPLQFTFSCIAPRDGKHCGQCNKCGERQLAFKRAQIADRTRYLKSQIPSTKSQTSPKSEDQNSKREQSVE
jgi:7-cyano-7-deazaguanine synthase